MRFLWAFRFNPLRAPGGSAKLLRNFAANPLRPTGFPGFGKGSKNRFFYSGKRV
ncbi:MAG: hypothetical protein LBK44_05320 [Spirochaetales bacterium]|nr:hypothetical protein [Spirochaetales bacterium]